MNLSTLEEFKQTESYEQFIKENPTITAKEISMKIGNRGLPAIKWNLKQLKNNGIIERKGTTRRGQWIIL